ncbi:hypothetical protein I3842_05G213800 [Carya illinoinensis]|uniref:DC1 domain-containing protein n=1 Tax=Carya illinoinensis TaxID=32201 RepID=A0A922F6A6_CARIL|nr:hypothetical protein I3842_05G213800 [Carya illinoinensis]
MAIRRKDTEERVTEGGDKLIHPHPMQFLENIPEDSKCRECGKSCGNKVYGCLQCRYFIHPSCHPVQKLEKEVQSLCHPCLLIGYVVRPSMSSFITQETMVCCNICGQRPKRGGVIFHCNECDFNLDPECIDVSPASPSNIKTVPDEELQSSTKYFSHEHSLILYNNIPRDRVECCVCGKYCSNNAYSCLPCAFFLDPSCAELKLPQKIQHFYHSYPLTLYIKPEVGFRKDDYWQTSACRVCHQKFPAKAGYYGCRRCDFVIDIDCTLLPASLAAGSSSQRMLHTIFHEHPLSLSQEENDVRVNCFVCGKGCNSSSSTYSCGRSTCRDIYIDKSCIELPPKIYHPFHLYHPLFLLKLEGRHAKCNACRKDIGEGAFAYSCHVDIDNCSFLLDIICGGVIVPAIKYEAHSHLLHFRERTDDLLKCNACDRTCESSIFNCLYCDWNIHYTCGPLPHSITHKCHEHPLVLTNALAEHEDEMDDEFYCDVCEKQRDQLLPSYQCTGSNFVAEIGCVISEVISLLRGDHGDHVELRDPFEQLGKLIMPPKNTIEDQMMQNKEEQSEPTLSLSKILKSLNEDESMELRRALRVREIRKTLLKGDHGELRDPFGQLGKLIMPPKNTIEDQIMQNKEEQSEPTLSLSEILKSLNEDVSMELRRVLEAREIRQTVNAEEKFFNDDPGEDNILQFFDKDYREFINFLAQGAEIFVQFWDERLNSYYGRGPAAHPYSGRVEVFLWSSDAKSHNDYFALEEEVVNVGEHHKAARTFAPILRSLLSKHGDISAASKLSPNVKIFFVNMLCGCINSMRNAKVVDITRDLLLLWWTSLKTCQKAGFKIQSVFDHLKRVADAFFGLYIGKQADKVDRDIAELAKDIAKLSEDVEELKRKRDSIVSSRKRDFVDKCLRQASFLKKGKAITERSWGSI